MAHRCVIDRDGISWDVWEVIPSAVQFPGGAHEAQPPVTRNSRRDSHLIVADNLQAGWLAFQSEHEKRRLAPVPELWNALEDELVVQLLEKAETVRHRGRSLE